MTFTTLARRVHADIGQTHRYAHCLRVARCAARLAALHGEDVRKARLAGMVHDLARLYSAERLLEECVRRGIPIDAYAAQHPIVLHAPLSARLAEEHFGVDEADVLSAVRKHTLGDGHMSPLDCIVYVADSLEPDRGFAERAELAALACRDLRAGTRATIASSVRYLEERHLPIAPQTALAMQAFGLMDATMEVRAAGDS